MKVDRSKLRRNHEPSEGPQTVECKELIGRLRKCSVEEFGRELATLKTWNFTGKIDLCQWIDVLDRCDEILGSATQKSDSRWSISADKKDNASMQPVVLEILRFLALLFDNTFSRHWFNSIDRLTALLDSSDMSVVHADLSLLYVIAKKTQYLSKLNPEQKTAISSRLAAIAEKWGGKEESLTLADCCTWDEEGGGKEDPSLTSVTFQHSSTTDQSTSSEASRTLHTVKVPREKLKESRAGDVMEDILRNSQREIPERDRVALMSRLRLAASFRDRRTRLLCVIARCQATSILMYGQLLQENQINSIVYKGLIDELVEVLKIPDPHSSLDDVKTEILKTLTATVYLDRNPKLHLVVEATGANSYHGFVPSLMRRVIENLIRENSSGAESERPGTSSASSSAAAVVVPPPLGVGSTQLAISLFSFIYHMAIYDGGAEPLVSSGMLESLLSVVNWKDCPIQSITFVTRSVRVIDLIASLDSQTFLSLNGMATIINRLMLEVNICRKEQGFQIVPPPPTAPPPPPAAPAEAVEGQEDPPVAGEETGAPSAQPMDVTPAQVTPTPSLEEIGIPVLKEPVKGVYCHPQRSALLKSLLNLVKRAIQEPQLADTTRHLMDGGFPNAIKHIVSNPDYYGSALFLNAMNVVTQFIYAEPGQLTSLQDKGLTNVIIQALLVREVPASREVLASLPSTFAALCLNDRGLQAFMACQPFDKLFKVLLSTKYLPAMKRRRTSDALGDTAMNLGVAVDELMRHQPLLKPGAMQAVVQLLNSLCDFGSEEKYECVAKWGGSKTATPVVGTDGENGGEGAGTAPNGTISHQASSNESSDEEEEEDEDSDRTPPQREAEPGEEAAAAESETTRNQRIPVPLMEYIGNVMKFIEAILSNNATDDHARLFVQHGGVKPLARLLALPNLGSEFGQSTAFGSVASVVRYIVTQARDVSVMDELLRQVKEEALPSLKTLQEPVEGSRLLEDSLKAVSESKNVLGGGQLMRGLAVLHNHLLVLGHVAKIGQGTQQNELKNLLLDKWTSDAGQEVLCGLEGVHRALVWESAVMLTLADQPQSYAQAQLEALRERADKRMAEQSGKKREGSKSGGEKSEGSPESMEVDGTRTSEDSGKAGTSQDPTPTSIVQELKPLVSASSKVGRQLSELLGVLVKSSLGGTARGRRGQNPFIMPPTPQGIRLVQSLCKGFKETITWNPLGEDAPLKLRMTYLIYVVAVISPLLLDERRQAYHLVLHHFFASGCQKALFQCLKGILEMGKKCEDASAPPPGVEEFLESWLSLVDKLVNAKNIVESQNKLLDTSPTGAVPRQREDGTPKTSPHFAPLQYLVATQKSAFEVIEVLWGVLGRLKSKKVTELTLSILAHILKSKKQIEKEMTKKEEESKKSGEERRREMEEDIDPLLLQSLVDMGFSRRVAIEALLLTNSLEGATEWLLSHPQGRAQEAMPGQQGLNVLMDEEEQLQQAIAMSLEQETGGTTEEAPADPPPAPEGNPPATESPVLVQGEDSAPTTNNEDEGERREEDGTEGGGEETAESPMEESPITEMEESSGNPGVTSSEEGGTAPEKDKAPEEAEVSSEKKEAVEEVERLSEVIPLEGERLLGFSGKEILPRCLQMMDGNPELVYRCADLMSVAVRVMGKRWTEEELLRDCLIGEARTLAKVLMSDCEKGVSGWWESGQAASLNTRLHLLCLLLTELKETCCCVAQSCDFDEILVELLTNTAQCVQRTKSQKLPKFMSPLLLWLDLHEKIAVASQRKRQIKEAGLKFTWKYWDNRQWMSFTPAVTGQIREAFERGEESLGFTVQRRRYMVDFGTMSQVNLESGYTRPILMLPEEKKKEEEEQQDGNKEGGEKKKKKKDAESGKKGKKEEAPPVEEEEEEPLPELRSFTLEQSAKIVHGCVELLDGCMEGDMLHAVLRLCLRLTRDSGVAGDLMNLGGLRKILNLRQSQSFTGMPAILSLLVRHVLEDDLTLTHTMEKVVRAVAQGAQHVPGQFFNQDDPQHRQPPEFHYAMRSLGPVAARRPHLFVDIVKRVVRFKVEGIGAEDGERADGPPSTGPLELRVEGSSVQTPLKMSNSLEQVLDLLLNYVGAEFDPGRTSPQGAVEVTEKMETDDMLTVKKSKEEEEGKEKKTSTNLPLVPKSAVLKMLAELIRSYSSVAGYLAQYKYKQEGTEECSALSYVLDNLLQPTMKVDGELLGSVRTLVATLSAANHSPDAQTCLVVEVKWSLQRALAFPESGEKHQRIMALVSLISLMKESCPNVQVQGHPPGTKVSVLTTNSILQKIVRKKLISDLGRVPLSLDLSSPHTVGTVNGVLKVLEELTRLINSPSTTTTGQQQPPPAIPGSRWTESVRGGRGGQPASTEIQENHTNTVPDRGENATNDADATRRGGTTDAMDGDNPRPGGEGGETGTVVGGVNSLDSSSLSESLPVSVSGERQEVAAQADELNAVRDSDTLGMAIHARAETESSSSSEDEGDSHADEEEDSTGGSDPEEDEMDGTQGMGGEEGGGNDGGSEHSDYELGDEDGDEEEVTHHLDIADMEADDDVEDVDFGQLNVEEEILDVMGEVFRAQMGRELPQRERLQDALQHGWTGGRTGIRLIVPRQGADELNVLFEGGGASELDGAGGGGAGSSSQQVGVNHPLLIRHADSPALPGGGAAPGSSGLGFSAALRWGGMEVTAPARHHGGLHRQGAVRQRGAVRLFMQAGNNNDQGILRRLFGAEADEVLSMQRGQERAGGFRHLVITDEDLRSGGLLDEWEESSSTRSTVVSVPSALSRWTEESRLLDGESVHYLVASLKGEIETELRRLRQAEWEEKREQVIKEKDKALKDKPPPVLHKEEVVGENETRADESSLSDSEGSHSPVRSGTYEEMGGAAMSAILEGMSTRREEPWPTSPGGAEAEVTITQPVAESAQAVATAIAEELVSASVNSATVTAATTSGDSSTDEGRTESSEVTTVEERTEESVGRTETSASSGETHESSSGETPTEQMQIEQDPLSNITNASSVTINSSGDGAALELVEENEERRSGVEAEAERNEGDGAESGGAGPPAPAGTSQDGETGEEARLRREADIQTYRHLLGDIDIPEGVDVSFLAALPEAMRQEVIEDHLRQQRVRRMREHNPPTGQGQGQPAPAQPHPPPPAAAAASQNGEPEAAGTAEIAPEFLDALPPEIQEEVLNQQRLQQQAANPPPQVDAMDPATFMETLPPSLRRQILADADDSQLQALPAHILREAQTLRAQLERQTLHQHARHFPYMDIFGGGRHAAYHVRQAQQRAGQAFGRGHTPAPLGFGTLAGSVAATQSIRGQQLLDKEALSGLLVLFFMEDQRLNIGRLHRILKSLCFHPGTRDWLVRALISILEQVEKSLKAAEGGGEESQSALSSSAVEIDGILFDWRQSGQTWLNLTVDTGLGNRANVFQIERKQTAGKKVSSVLGAPGPKETILIHRLVGSAVCRHVLDSLISLGKSFPGQFVPNALRKTGQEEEGEKEGRRDGSTDLWQILLRLDSGNQQGPPPPPITPISGRPGSARSRLSARSASGGLVAIGGAVSEEAKYLGFHEAPLGRMMMMLNHPVVLESMTLVDRLLRLLSSVVMALPDDSPARIREAESGEGSGTETVLDEELRLVVDVVTRGKCSEDGLQDGRNLLLESVRAFGRATRHSVIKLLLGAAQKLGEELGEEIGTFLSHLAQLPKSSLSEEAPAPGTSREGPGTVQDRFDQTRTVVISGRNVAKAAPSLSSCPELQLGGVSKLTAKGSIQNHLLRTLNTVIQVREAVKARDRQIRDQEKRDTEEREAAQAAAAAAAAVAAAATNANVSTNNAEEVQNGTTTAETPEEGTESSLTAPAGTETGPAASTEAPAPEEPMDTSEPPVLPPSGAGEEEGKPAKAPVKVEEETEKKEVKEEEEDPLEVSQLSHLLHLERLWEGLSRCLKRLGEASDPHAVLILQPAAETFFLVHATEKQQQEAPAQDPPAAAPPSGAQAGTEGSEAPLDTSGVVPSLGTQEMSSYNIVELTGDTQKLVNFAEDHRRVLNQILRQSSVPLSEGPFSVLIDYPKLLDFDVKRKYFKKELTRLDDRTRFSRRDDVPLRVRRNQVFQESYRELFRLRPAEWKNRFFVIFEGEEGQDAGGLLREWFTVITREIFNPNYALFKTSPGDRVTYMINEASYINVEHLDYFKFVGHFIAKAVYDGKLLECYFTRAFYKHILNKPVRYQDLESEDPSYFKSLDFVKENPVDVLGMDLNFSVEVEEFGVREVRDLKPGGRDIPVTDETKEEYIRLVCQMKMTGAIRKQLQSFLEGFYSLVPKKLISIFNEQELELLISGLPNVDVEDLQNNTDYHKYTKTSLQIQWFWRALRSFEQEDRAKFLQFLTGTSKVPLQGFAHLEGMNGIQKFSIHRDDRSTHRLPTAHTCFNQLDLPVYESYDKLREMLLIAIHEGSEGFGFA